MCPLVSGPASRWAPTSNSEPEGLKECQQKQTGVQHNPTLGPWAFVPFPRQCLGLVRAGTLPNTYWPDSRRSQRRDSGDNHCPGSVATLKLGFGSGCLSLTDANEQNLELTLCLIQREPAIGEDGGLAS